jgi:flagellar hook-associated protein 2
VVTVTTSSTSSAITFNGVSTGIDTTALVNAIVAQKGTGVARLKAQQDLNNQKTSALTVMRTSLMGLTTSLAALQDKLSNRSVTSTDANNTNATASATAATSGSYDLTVHTVATRGRLSTTPDANGLPTNLAVASPSDMENSPVFTSGWGGTFAVQGTDGKIYTVTLDESSNSLNSLRDQINAVAGSSVTASVVNTGKGDKPYQLVLTAKDTGTGSTQGKVTIADVTYNDGTTSVNSLGISAGILDAEATILTGGLSSTLSGVATDATFTLNGIDLTRSTNVIKDAVDGMTFTLRQGGQQGTTTFSTTSDATGATTALQDFITKYNQLVKDYKTASASTRNADGSIKQAPLSGDAITRNLMANLKATLAGASAGLPSSATYKSLASLGIANQSDGSLYLNTTTFQNAMKNDPASVQGLFTFLGTSTNAAVALKDGGPEATTGTVGYTITKDGNGTLWGTLSQNGQTSKPIQVVDGLLVGTDIYGGLSLSVSGPGSGTLTLSRGAAQAAKDFLASFTGATGAFTSSLNTITTQNSALAIQIKQGQARLDLETKNLKAKFAQMESVVGQMKASSASLFGA